jgi:glutamyl-tRNA reductase
MQFRDKGKSVLCIRTEYDKEKKRTFGKTVARQDSSLSIITNEVEREITKEEFQQFKAWLHDRKQEKLMSRLDSSLSIVGMVMSQAAKRIRMQDDEDGFTAELDDKQVDEILEGLEDLKKALRHRGVKLKRQTKKESAKSQQGLEGL